MRVFGAMFIMILLTLGVMLYLQGQDAEKSMDAVDKVSQGLLESGVEGEKVDRSAAKSMISSMEALIASPETIEDNLEGLREIGSIAQSWAHASPSPSADLHMAVGLRGAASELRSYAAQPSDLILQKARKQLAKARDGLMGRAGGSGPTDGIADRLENLERSQKEMYQEINELGN